MFRASKEATGMKVNKERLRTVDTTGWADRPRLFVDAFGGWCVLEYMRWVDEMKAQYHTALGEKKHNIFGGLEKPEDMSIRDHADFDRYLKECVYER